MGFECGKCLVLSGIILQAGMIALLSLSLTQPDFFLSYFPEPAEGSNYEYKTDSYGEDCVAARIGLLHSKYNPLCSGGVTSGTEAFEVPTTEYFPLFPIRLIQNKYNPLKEFGVAYTGCESTIDEMYAVGDRLAQGSAAQLVSMLSLLPEPLFTSPQFWVVPTGQGYQALQMGLAGAGLEPADAARVNATAVPLLQACTSAPGASRDSCAAFITQYVGGQGPTTINGYLSIAFNKEITSRDAAVQSCHDDNEDFRVLETAKSCWIAALALSCISLITSFVVQFTSGKKAMILAGTTAVFSAASGICVFIAFLELNSAPATEDVGKECVAGIACYEKETNVLVGLAAMVLNAIVAVLFTIYGIVLFRGARATPEDRERKVGEKSSSNSSLSNDDFDSDQEAQQEIGDKNETQTPEMAV